ncbi:DUF3016 domain-containing protein [Iodobacter ciconiae]|uniref:DUF3016 domain-containing protein n=1 Tax=Iodobacter ciconiae TaxID=2496266 RepID=A0A3S8ZPC6_9NEIS|nr:DUF3016 domain-containing protein [Iodobacter ciconiae]AZN35320.1 DUF3016 domain-containing protein [Iodobacter ciconiae]
MKTILLSLALLGLLSSPVWAGEAKITWQSPERYSDIRAAHERQDRFQERLFKHFDNVFASLAALLPDNALLEITITDFDLAGEINPQASHNFNEIRIIKEIYNPKITFNYIFSHEGRIVSNTENLRDMNYMSGISRSSHRKEFEFEEKMLKAWFSRLQKNQIFSINKIASPPVALADHL